MLWIAKAGLTQTLPFKNDSLLIFSTDTASATDSLSVFFVESLQPNAGYHISQEHFNPGIIHHASQLIQGRVPGGLVSRVGGDPLAPFSVLFHGVSTFYGNTLPLLVIDGIPAAFQDALDPDDIASITILNDPVALARYGARAGAGVILIHTKSNEKSRPQIRYSGSFGLEQPIKRIKPLEAGAFLGINGATDLGSATNWLEEITRIGSTQVHHLALSGPIGQGGYRAAFHHRNVQGILPNSGFERLNGRLSLSQSFLQNLIQLGLQLFSTTGEEFPGDSNIFRYAFSTNPTLPVFGSFGGSSGNKYGGYAQREIFDAYNPAAMIAQNIREGKKQAWGSLFRAEIAATTNVRAYLMWSEQQIKDNLGQYSTKTSLYGGGLQRNGLATQTEDQSVSSTIETGLNFEKKISGKEFSLSASYFFQTLEERGTTVQAGNFLTDAFLYHNLGAALDVANGNGFWESYKSSRVLSAFSTQAHVRVHNIWSLFAGLRYEGASHLGRDNRWGFYPALSSTLSLASLLKAPKSTQLNLRGGYGVVGNLPRLAYLSQELYSPSGRFFYNGMYEPSYTVTNNGNPRLGAERSTLSTLGLDFAFLQNRIKGSFGVYRHFSRNLILPVQVPVPPNPATLTWKNTAALKNNGIEAQLAVLLVRQVPFSWQIDLNLSTFNTTIANLPQALNSPFLKIYSAAIGAPGHGDSESSVRSSKSGPLGIIRGPELKGINPDGSIALRDISGDGQYCYCEEDHTTIGNGLPKFSVGLGQSLALKRFQLSFFLRAVMGHDLLNTLRLFYENTAPYTLANYNIIQTRYYNPALKQSLLSDFYVEKANFLELQYIQLSYNLPISEKGPFSKFKIHFTGQNLAIFSPYTGIHPEVRIPGADMLAPGIERRDTYLPVRTLSLGANVFFR